MKDKKKQIVSMRISGSDLEKVKDIAKRLQAKEADIYRFAVKNVLAKLAPLHDVEATGKDLMPVFVDYGTEIASHFELDGKRLDRIINGDVTEPARRVDREDMELIAMSAMPEHYLYIKLRELTGASVEPDGVAGALRAYLRKKYMEGPAEE